MASNKKNAVLNTVFQLSSIIYLMFIGIILVPMYLKYIPVDLYGYWLASGNIIAWIGAFDPGVSSVMQQRIGVSLGSGDYKKIGKHIGSSIIISISILFILSIILFVIYHYIFGWIGIKNFDYQDKLKVSLICAGIGTLFSLQSFGFVGINYGLQLYKPVGFLSLSTNLVGIACTFLLLPMYGIKALGIAILLRGFIDLAGNIFILWIFLKTTTITIKFSYVNTQKLFADVSFNFFAKFGNLLTDNSQSFFITRYITPEAAVIFRFTKTIPEVSKIFISRPAAAIMPIFSNYLGKSPALEDVKLKISKMIFYTVWSSGLIFIGFILLNKTFINLWVGNKFYAGNLVNCLIVLWVVLSSLTNNLSYTVFALGDLRKNNIVVFFESILFFALMILMIKPLGILGIALALLLSQTIIPLIYFPRRLHQYLRFNKNEIKVMFQEIAYVSLIIIVIYLTALYINFLPVSWSEFISYTSICFVCYISGLYFISKTFKSDINHLFSYIKKILNNK